MNSHRYDLIHVRQSGSTMKEFIEFPKRLYQKSDYYVPMFDTDMKKLLKKRHPFFLHSDGDYFLLNRDGETAARSLVVENTRYNDFHTTSFAFFDYFDSIDDQEGADILFGHMREWARNRGLKYLVGPMLSGGTGGAGILIRGFEHTPAMTMMRYNYPYYQSLLEKAGFTKYLDLHSFTISPDRLVLPERIKRLGEIVLKRGRFSVVRFSSKGEIRKVVSEIKDLYAKTLTHHLEDYPLSPEELDQVEEELLTIADPDLITLLRYDGRIIGYVFGFADISRTLHINRGRLSPLSILRILTALRRSDRILFNGMGILPEYQRLGGNALLYRELEHIVTKRSFKEIEMVQISEKTDLMIADAKSLGANPFKIHRLYMIPVQE